MSAPAEVRETHIGLVLLAGGRAYKAKKPVRTAFCDFSTVELRRAAIARELELNSRLAPDVYLGTAELTGAGETEPVLVMRRMRESARLSTLVRSGADVRTHLRRTARLLAAFHAGAARGPAIRAAGSAEALWQRWLANVTEMEPYREAPLPGDVLDDVRRLAERFVAGRGPLLARRGERVVDGHGDLLAEDVFCLDDGPRVLDCLDFDDRLRFVDGLDDVAFLAMDLEHLGAPDAAEQLLDDYAEFSADPAPMSLRHHYVAYRAGVRAKVACLRHAQDGRRDTADEARAQLRLAHDHLRRGEPRLALVGGLPGTGKSTLAGALADLTGAVLLSSDRLRKEQAGLAASVSAAAEFHEGLYDAAHTDRTYDELVARAEALLHEGESVVLDASWTDARHRGRAADVAGRTESRLVQIECTAPPALAAERIRTRHDTVSDATPRIALALAEVAAPWPEAVPVATTSPPEVCACLAHDLWR